jgi:catechol 2,3-dioxygenase-like lactoylglutathione lyase family enzyme
MNVDSTIRIRDVGVVAVPVTDQDRALDFYVGTLGLEKRRDMPFGPGLRWVEVAPPGSNTTLALVPPGENFSPGRDTGIRLFAADADQDHAALAAAGADVDPEVLRFGDEVPPMFVLRDPDGNVLYVVQA